MDVAGLKVRSNVGRTGIAMDTDMATAVPWYGPMTCGLIRAFFVELLFRRLVPRIEVVLVRDLLSCVWSGSTTILLERNGRECSPGALIS